MPITRAIIPVVIALAVGATGLSAVGCAATERTVYAPEPPPDPRHEVIPEQPGPRHAWIPGHWEWRPEPKRYVWKPGRWQRIRHAHHRHWIPGEWKATRSGYVWMPGHWR